MGLARRAEPLRTTFARYGARLDVRFPCGLQFLFRGAVEAGRVLGSGGGRLHPCNRPCHASTAGAGQRSSRPAQHPSFADGAAFVEHADREYFLGQIDADRDGAVHGAHLFVREKTAHGAPVCARQYRGESP